VRIPAAALSVEDAMMLHRMIDRGQQPVVKLTMGAQTLPDAPSRNVVAELRGSEKPDEVIVVGGHIDSWDVGQGAMDDAGGSVAAWQAVVLMKKLGLRPRRTVRVVMWTNEENGSRGALGYRDTHAAELDKHIMAMESDNGVFKPLGFQVAGDSAAFQAVRDIASLMSGIGANRVIAGGPEADVGPLNERGVPALALQVEGSRYFHYHHSEADTMDKLSPREMAECVAMIAVVSYIVADMPGNLGRAPRVEGRR
jgi:carboxypeptidase Q